MHSCPLINRNDFVNGELSISSNLNQKLTKISGHERFSDEEIKPVELLINQVYNYYDYNLKSNTESE